MSQIAPIAFFIFNRPDHTRRTLASLIQCAGFDEGRVVVFGDGPKGDEHIPEVEAARAVAHEILGHRAEYRFSATNKGLARSIIDGVGELVETFGRVIVIEDDLILSQNFLVYMHAALDRYAEDPKVFQIAGHCFAVPEFVKRKAGIFLPFASTWGWGTWARAWRQFDEKATGWEALASDPGLRMRFNMGGVYDYSTMLKKQMTGQRDSWGVRWYWTIFKNGGLTLFPPRSLVTNIGMDGSGTHGRGLFRKFDEGDSSRPNSPIEFPPTIVDPSDVLAIQRAIWTQNGGGLGYCVDALKRIAATVLRR